MKVHYIGPLRVETDAGGEVVEIEVETTLTFDEIDQLIEDLKEAKEYIEEMRAKVNDYGAWEEEGD
jgi:sensor histidine kinase regulating citrate/malate metabolism